MNIVHTQEKNRFDLFDGEGRRIGEIEYKPGEGNTLYATHTEVFKGNEGQGHAARLLDALVAYAEGRGATIRPVCSYVKAMFKKYPEKYAAVIQG